MATTTITQTAAGTYTWLCPPGVVALSVELWGSGGKGGTCSTTGGGGGGGGGAYAKKAALTVTPGTTYTYIVGAASGTTKTTFNSTDVVADFGLSVANNSATGVNGGTVANSVGDVGAVFKGGRGANASVGVYGGGGGEGASSAGAGNDAIANAGGTGTAGADGGAGKLTTQGAGSPGVAPGGAGGGGLRLTSGTNNGGAGSDGKAILVYTNPPISALTDNFNDNSIDAAKWSNYGWLEQNQELEETTSLGGSDNYINSKNLYDLTGSYTTLKLVDAGNTGLASRYLNVLVVGQTTSANRLFWYIRTGNIIATDDTNGTNYSATYVAATYKYLRIRESGGSIYWDYSADGLAWTNAVSKTNPFVVTSMLVYFEDYVEVELSTTTAKVDDFNILPSGYSGQVLIMND